MASLRKDVSKNISNGLRCHVGRWLPNDASSQLRLREILPESNQRSVASVVAREGIGKIGGWHIAKRSSAGCVRIRCIGTIGGSTTSAAIVCCRSKQRWRHHESRVCLARTAADKGRTVHVRWSRVVSRRIDVARTAHWICRCVYGPVRIGLVRNRG